MGYHTKKKAGRSPGSHPYTDMDMKHAGWCLRNGISICVSPNWEGLSTQWLIEIRINGNTHVDPKIYTAAEAYKKMYKYYKYYYDKYKK
jgi:hypothetical protein|tara:strand:+ start:236 stop:502 length:267 start_codon:yes stop_codon:yes gene_type:complete